MENCENKVTEELETEEKETSAYDTVQALEDLRATIESIPRSDLRRVLFSRENATVVGMKTAALFREDRARIAASINTLAFEVGEYDNIEERTRAFWAADIQLRQATGAEAPITLLAAETKELRQKLLKAATYLWDSEEETAEVLSDIRGGSGKANLADDIASLATLFADRWESVRHSCTLEFGDVERAAKLGVLLVQAMGSTDVDEAAILRSRAAEYLRRGIEEIRYAAAYTFRHDQAAFSKYPSLYTRRRKRQEVDHEVIEAEESFSGVEVSDGETDDRIEKGLAGWSPSITQLPKVDEPLSAGKENSF